MMVSPVTLSEGPVVRSSIMKKETNVKVCFVIDSEDTSQVYVVVLVTIFFLERFILSVNCQTVFFHPDR